MLKYAQNNKEPCKIIYWVFQLVLTLEYYINSKI